MFTILLSVLFPAATKAVILGNEPGCESELISTELSPDHHWNAEVFKLNCGDGYYQSTADYVVRLMSAKNLEHRIDVFAIENHGSQTLKPVIYWLNKQHLQIQTTGNAHGVGLLEQKYKGVIITYVHA